MANLYYKYDMNTKTDADKQAFSPDSELLALMNRVHSHSIFSSLTTKEALTVFMKSHVYAVWDFMSLVKTVQAHLAPTMVPWIPSPNNSVVHAINEIVLSEESDTDMDGNGSCSHFELYLDAMRELQISVYDVLIFIENVRNMGISKALELSAPTPAFEFVGKTFSTIKAGDPLVTACWFAYGREKIIPGMFLSALNELAITREQAPTLYFYLERHTELDGGAHSLFAQQLVDHFCEADAFKISIAQQACKNAISARLQFWDGVLENINTTKDFIRNCNGTIGRLSV